MKKSMVVFAILLLGIILGTGACTYYSINNSQTLTQQPTANPTPTIQPTNNLTVTPQPTISPTPPAPTATIIARPSTLRVISPIINATYKTSTIDLTYSINSKVLWSYYELDSSGYVKTEDLFKLNGLIPFKGNITLNLSEGSHRITISVQTEESRFSSVPIAYQTIDFTINTTSDGSFS